ncbi:MAG: VWA domain-containing protein [Roseibium album]|uniref:VWA domain-containing protein n=1 Tax=Roseibium album TaxID=311410 RepID=UPI0032EE6647
MELTLARFVHALRSADLPVSPAETLDAFDVVRAVGVADPVLLHDALALTLAKTLEEKQRFAECFDRFFHQLAFRQPAKRTLLRGVDADALLARTETLAGPELQALLTGILRHDQGELAWLVQRQAEALDLGHMQSLRDRGRLAGRLAGALGLDELRALLERGEPADAPEFATALRYLRQYVQEQINAYVDDQYRLRVDATGRRAIIDAALSGNLDQLPPGYHAEVDRVVQKLAARLARQHRRRRRRANRGSLDLKRTLRDNVAYDGALFHLHWRRRRRERATVFVVCDLSSSVSRIARFLLMFLYELADVLPSVRTFGFSNRLGELTGLFQQHDAAHAVEEALFVWGKGTTDYGQALFDFRELTGRDLDRHSVVIFLGDARGNYYPPRVDLMRDIDRRAKQVFWLTPESAEHWGEGDSLMRHYAPFCLRVDTCSRLTDIERFADRLLTITRPS